MVQRQIIVERAAPLLASGVSGMYILARARRLAIAEAVQDPFFRFLFTQSDVILMLCGSHMVWYFLRRQRQPQTLAETQYVRGPSARAIHQLRQVFTTLLLGTELLGRKAASGKTGDIVKLAQRLNHAVREGLEALAVLGDPYPADLVDKRGTPLSGPISRNGTN